MGELYTVIPYDGSYLNWIESDNITIDSLENGRFPTLKEIESALIATGLDCEWFVPGSDNPKVQIDRSDGAWTCLILYDYIDEDTPCDFYFESGWDEIIHIVVASISKTTGPLIVVPHSMDGIVVIHGEKVYKAKMEDNST